MSFILDAIAKSERERQQQQAPDASRLAFPAASPAPSRSTTPYLLAGLLLLGSAILAAVWMQSPRSMAPIVGPGGTAMPTTPAATDQPLKPAEPGDTPPVAPVETQQPVSTKPMLADAAATEATARRRTPVVDEKAADSAAESTSDTPGAAVDSLSGTADKAPASEIDAADSRQASLASRQDGVATDAPVAAAKTPSSVTEVPSRRVVRLYDLPADVRQALPTVQFTGHLYSKNPRASYVFVDGGRQVVAGQQIVDELVLDEITPTGVVVEFQGYLIEVGVLQNWRLY